MTIWSLYKAEHLHLVPDTYYLYLHYYGSNNIWSLNIFIPLFYFTLSYYFIIHTYSIPVYFTTYIVHTSWLPELYYWTSFCTVISTIHLCSLKFWDLYCIYLFKCPLSTVFNLFFLFYSFHPTILYLFSYLWACLCATATCESYIIWKINTGLKVIDC